MRITRTALASTILLLSASSAAWALSDPAEDPAVTAALAREMTVKTLNMEFKQTEVIAKGAITTLRVAPHKPATLNPKTETTLTSVNRLVMDGHKLRYEDNRPLAPVSLRGVTPRSKVVLFNGSAGATFYPTGGNGAPLPWAVIERDASAELQWSPELLPVQLAFRGVSELKRSRSILELKPTGKALRIEDGLCQEYLLAVPMDTPWNCWLDATKDYVVRRMQRQEQKSRIVHRMDIHYRHDPAWGWVPSSWVYEIVGQDGEVLLKYQVDVTALRLNEPQASEQFDLQFPAGCNIHDQRDDKDYRVQPDGSLRELSWTGEEIPLAEPDAWYRRDSWLLVAVGIAALVLPFALRRRRAKAT